MAFYQDVITLEDAELDSNTIVFLRKKGNSNEFRLLATARSLKEFVRHSDTFGFYPIKATQLLQYLDCKELFPDNRLTTKFLTLQTIVEKFTLSQHTVLPSSPILFLPTHSSITLNDYLRTASTDNKSIKGTGCPSWFQYILDLKCFQIYLTASISGLFSHNDYSKYSMSYINKTLGEHFALQKEKASYLVLYLYDQTNKIVIAFAVLRLNLDQNYIEMDTLASINSDKIVEQMIKVEPSIANCYKAVGAMMMTACLLLSAKFNLRLHIGLTAPHAHGFYIQFGPSSDFDDIVKEKNLVGVPGLVFDVPSNYDVLNPGRNYYLQYHPELNRSSSIGLNAATFLAEIRQRHFRTEKIRFFNKYLVLKKDNADTKEQKIEEIPLLTVHGDRESEPFSVYTRRNVFTLWHKNAKKISELSKLVEKPMHDQKQIQHLKLSC